MEWTRGRTIGRGSTATVSLAVPASSGEPFAVKSTELSHSMFLQQEQHLLSKLRSPYIVKYIGFDISYENNKQMYNLCMEYVHGGTLYDVIQRHGGQLDEPTIRLYTRHILQGLDYLHTNRLVHCDIKSQNVLVNEDGAKIADFGCARIVEEETADIKRGRAVSAFSGTPAFMAPEVARGEEQGFPADVWAVGCTIVEMATGSNPWAELDDPVSALYRIGFSGDVPECPRWLSQEGRDFLSKCFRTDPKERCTIKELLDHPFLEELELSLVEVKEFTMSSPSCVLDQDYWDSMDDALESPQDLTIQGCLDSPAERIKRLIECGFSSVSNVPTWTWEEDWVTVRSGDFEETGSDVILANELPSGATELLLSDLIDYDDQELARSILDQDLPSQFNREDVSGSSISSDVRSSRLDDLPLDYYNNGDLNTVGVDDFVPNLSILCNAISLLVFVTISISSIPKLVIVSLIVGKQFAIIS
ncbi:hypothetical protein Tsubulata_002366 [Turnera subulata]|uniref:Protein kinase domain-containing protein n=1 Tax=Turnera subulata TaxID=218843 RepID=A0A9Q0G8J7_9ROSI|nr:hypothetical protein Tsubulata_002366 [Turnera subulata]